jgi:hypothetical protein
MSRKRGAEEIIGCILGMTRDGDVVRVSVYQKGRDIRLSRPHRPNHWVDQSNIGSSEGWQNEASEVWDLTHMSYLPLILFNSEIEKVKLQELNAAAATRKERLEEHAKRATRAL